MVSLQNPRTDVSGLKPEWIDPKNHLVAFFWDADFSDEELVPKRDQIGEVIDWLTPRCGPDSSNRFLIHCDAGLGRSPAIGYITWAIHLGEGREEEAFAQMTKCAIETKLVPNTIIVKHADAILGRNGKLQQPLTAWNRRVPWRRTFR